MTCVHDFRCSTCGGEASILEAQIAKFERGARAALGYLVNGQRADAEATLREALAPTEDAGDA